MNVASTFLGMHFGDTPGYVPPDTIAASGPTEIIETVNTDIAIYTKSGAAILSPTNLATFFQSVGPINQLSDSAVEYDELSGTFFVSVLNITLDIFGNPSADSFLYAVSNTNSPTSASNFTFHSVDLTGLDPAGSGSFWADFPRIGWNGSAYVASFNMFTNGFIQNYDHALVLNLEVTAPSTGILALVPGGTANGTLAPATMHGSAATDPMYLVEESSASPGRAITVVAETNLFNFTTGPSFTFKDVALPAADDYSVPPAATQKGSTTQTISTNDSRILNAEWRNNHLVAAHAIGVTTDAQAHARWYEFDTTNYTSTGPTFIQAGTIGLGSGANSYFPSIAIGANDVLGMTYMESSPTEYMSMYVAGRLASDAPGTMETTSVAAQAGVATYTGLTGVESSPPYRAGDFSGTTVDPSDGTFWSANEFANTDATANWGTAITNFTLSNPLLPTDMAVTVTGPSSVTAGTNATYTITITNNGPNAAQGVVLSDTLPAGSTFMSMTRTAGTDTFTFTQSGGTATETATANIASGSSDTFSLVVFAPSSLANAAPFNDTASVSASNPDPNTANNTATVTGSIVNTNPNADLSVSVSGPASANEGATVTYNITVTNAGPSSASSVTLTDALASILNFKSATASQGTFTRSGGVVTFSIGTVASGGTVTASVTAQAIEDGATSNTASVSSSSPDPNPANNSASATTSFAEPAISVSAPIRTRSQTLTNFQVATFTHANAVEPVSTFAATINWGDGTTSPGTITLSGTTYIVRGSHTYSGGGRHTISTSVTEIGSSPFRVIKGGDKKPGGDLVHLPPNDGSGGEGPRGSPQPPGTVVAPPGGPDDPGFVISVTLADRQEGTANASGGAAARVMDQFFATRVTDPFSGPAVDSLTLHLVGSKHSRSPVDWFADLWSTDSGL